MKFDKLMNLGYKFLCVAVALAVVLGCVSCCLSPVKAHAVAVDLDAIEIMNEFKEHAEQRAVEVGRAINTDIANGNIDATTQEGKKILQAFAAQMLYIQSPAMRTITHAVDLALQTVPDYSEIEALPDDTTFSGSGATGLYRSRQDGKIHTVTIQPITDFGVPVAFSDEFSLTLTYSGNDFPNIRPYFNDNGYYIYAGTSGDTYGSGTFTLSGNSSYFVDSTWSDGYNIGSFTVYITKSNQEFSLSGSPVINQYNNSFWIGGQGVGSSFPSGSAPTLQPWKYYNDTLLPDIYNNYGDINNTYILFPNGYQPAPTPDPTEPATFPNGGVWIGNNYDIDINFYTPTDASGQPITDEQGETVTETYAVTDSRPTDAVYRFQIPTLPHIEKYSAENVVPDLSSFSEGIRFVFAATTDVLQESGFLPVVVAGLSLGAVAAVLMLL